jgi:hypothetical protein
MEAKAIPSDLVSDLKRHHYAKSLYLFITFFEPKIGQQKTCQWRRQIVPDGGVKVYRSG